MIEMHNGTQHENRNAIYKTEKIDSQQQKQYKK